MRSTFRVLCLAGFAAAMLSALPLTAGRADEAPDPATQEERETWQGLVQDIFGGRAMQDGSGVIGIEMPARAEDAAVVPVTLHVTPPPGDQRSLRAVTLVIDRNPAPMAARFEIGDGAAVSEISTRVRVNSYTYVHAVAELSDGTLYMTRIYVKASGGCSAPAAKNPDEAVQRLGKIRLRQFAADADGPASKLREAEIMIGHPNNSGLQMDQVTHLYVPAFFVNDVHAWQDDKLIFAMEGGIAISEDPNIRFSYLPGGAREIKVEARDTDGHVYQGRWPVESSGM